MDIACFSPLVGGWLNSLTVHAEPWITNWLTPIWILGLGMLLGLLVVLLLWGLGSVLSRVPALDRIASGRESRWMAIALVTIGLFIAVSPLLWRQVNQGWAVQAEVTPGQKISDVVWSFGSALAATLFAAVSLITLCRRRTIEELGSAFQEGPLFWLSSGVLAFALFGLLGVVLVRDPEQMLQSLERWPKLGRSELRFTIPAPKVDQFSDAPEVPIDVNFRKTELRQLRFESNESLRISAYKAEEKPNAPDFDVSGGEPLAWKMTGDPTGPFGDLDNIDAFYVRNLGNQDADLTITAQTAPTNPQMLTVPFTALAVAAAFLLYVIQRSMTPKMAAVAFATAKSEMATPFFTLLTAGGAFLLLLFLWLPYNTFGEDIKMLKFSSLDLIRLLAILQSVWSASSSVADEVEGRTALTVLSKPVSRRDFVIGKFVGIAWTVAAMFTVFSIAFLLSVAYKPIYDSREGGSAPTEITWQLCFHEMIGTIPGLVLVYLETLVMAAISVAISTRLSLIPNITICLAIYVLGHLTPLIVQSNVVAERFEAVVFVGQLIATIIPVLDHYDIQAAIAGNKTVDVAYVAATAVYTALYSAIAMLLGLVFFEDRDLA